MTHSFSPGRLGGALGAVVLLAAVCLSPARAQLEIYEDYDVSDAVWEVTTIKVETTQLDQYLEGIRETWAAGNEVAMKLGHIEGYRILRSELAAGGGFNLMLMVKYKNTEQLAPSKARYDAFMAEWTREREAESRETAKAYPAMRELTGQYHMREIRLK